MTVLAYTCADLVNDALIEIGAAAPGDLANMDGDEQQWAFRKLNDLIDEWQARAFYVFGFAFSTFNTVAGLSPHTIGPDPGNSPNNWAAPTFSTGTDPAPTRIRAAAQVQNPGQNGVDLPINIRDEAWWAGQPVKTIQTNVITDLYYNSGAPLGSLFFWPVPNASVQVRLEIWQTVAQFKAITDPIGGPGGPGIWPRGYRNALKLTLSERLLPGENKSAHPKLEEAAKMARKAVLGNNTRSPKVASRDYGMPRARSGGKRGDFNWLSGGRPGGRPE